MVNAYLNKCNPLKIKFIYISSCLHGLNNNQNIWILEEYKSFYMIQGHSNNPARMKMDICNDSQNRDEINLTQIS